MHGPIWNAPCVQGITDSTRPLQQDCYSCAPCPTSWNYSVARKTMKPTTQTILISVTIPAFNCEAAIGRCLQSLIDQTLFKNLEILVIDDGSTDETCEIVESFAIQNTEIHLVNKQIVAQQLLETGDLIGLAANSFLSWTQTITSI